MGSLVYLAAVIAFALLVHWTVQNDQRVQRGERSIGIYAMKEGGADEPEEPEPPKPRKRKTF